MTSRRRFLAAAAAGLALPRCRDAGETGEAGDAPAPLALGYDNFALRAFGWEGPELIDEAARRRLDSLFITDLESLGGTDEATLKSLRQRASDAGVDLYLGTWSVCPSSVTFRDDWGDADEHLALGIRCAEALGSPVLRVILGSHKDRLTEGGIEARIADTVEVLQRARPQAHDAGVRIAMENHAGDMHSLELKRLVEAAGSDFVGVNLDPGNACWALEHPLGNLENLGPHVLTTSMRDSVVWREGPLLKVQWTAMGEGMVDWKAYFERFAALCPQAPVHIETISGFARAFEVGEEGFLEAWPDGLPTSSEAFLEWADGGSAIEPWSPPEGAEEKAAQREYQMAELDRSLAYCRELGLGRA